MDRRGRVVARKLLNLRYTTMKLSLSTTSSVFSFPSRLAKPSFCPERSASRREDCCGVELSLYTFTTFASDASVRDTNINGVVKSVVSPLTSVPMQWNWKGTG